MASILLSYVDSDQAEAKRLFVPLEGAGHEVIGADFDRPSLQETDIVLVIWSAAALASPYVYEQARVALSSHCLVQVIAANFDGTQLPSVFRTRPLTPIADATAVLGEIETVLGRSNSAALASIKDPNDGPRAASDKPALRKAVASVSQVAPKRPPISARPRSPRSKGPETPDELALGLEDIFGQTGELQQSPPTARQRIPPHLAKAALEREAGRLHHRIPTKLRVGTTEIVEVRLGRAQTDAAMESTDSGDLAAEELLIVETMTVDLHGSADAFRILRRSRPTQLVKTNLIWRAPLNEQRFGRWLWHVTPKKSGRHELTLNVSADLSDIRGVAATESYADRTYSVKIGVNIGQASVRALKWTAAGAVSGLVGAFTQEIWWPRLKALLVGTGLLG